MWIIKDDLGEIQYNQFKLKKDALRYVKWLNTRRKELIQQYVKAGDIEFIELWGRIQDRTYSCVQTDD